ncbi:MAG: hypothetical protein ABI543_10470 [Ignavibacteria bacterium]
MKTVSDDLFRLIKSLNKSEKGYFKKFAAKNEAGGKQNYIVLFEAIDRMEEYDEEHLKVLLKKESFIKQLPVYKVYLFNLILKSLGLYGAIDNSTAKIRELLEYSKTLSSKALYKEALKLLKKAKETAGKFSSHLLMLEILVAERNIFSVMPDKNISEIRKKIYEDEIKTTDILKKLYEYSWLSDQMVICVEQKGDFTTAQSRSEMEKIYNSELISDYSNAEDINMKFYFLHTKLFYHLGKNELTEVRELLKKEIILLEESRFFIDDNPTNYSSCLVNYLLFSQITGARKDVLETITKLNILRKKLKNKVPLSLQLKITFQAANSEILVYRNSCDMRRGRNVIKRVESELPKYEAEIPPQLKISLLCNIAAFLVLDDNYPAALKINNKVLDETGMNFKSDIHRFSKILNLVIHYALKHYDHLEYLIESTYKFFREKNLLFKAEKLLFSHFKMLVKEGEREHSELFRELHFNLKKLEADNHVQELFSLFDFISWAKSRADNISMVDEVKNKTEKNNR